VASTHDAALLLVSHAVLISMAIREHETAQQTRTELAAVQRQRGRIKAEQLKLDAELRRPENAIVLDRNIMINDMIRRKAISWTRIFEDLERVLPDNVRVTVIRPQVNSRDQLSLDMTVESESPESVIGLIAKLESSDVFGSTEVSTWTAPNQNDPYYHYRLSVNYAQKL
jgi:type IV pilus assembly protein PilN